MSAEYMLGCCFPIIVIAVVVVALIKEAARKAPINRMIEENSKTITNEINKKK